MKTIIEVLCGSVRDCIVAEEMGGDRIELNNGTLLGGLTPSIATLIEAKKHVKIPMIAMVRPRTGGFYYDEWEYEQMKIDAQFLLDHGADGIVFGFLTLDRKVDVERTKVLTEMAHAYGREAVYHRAFDNVADPYEAIEALIECGIDRILTSGLETFAIEGVDLLKDLHEKYGDKIALLPGGGVGADNAQTIIDKTGIHEIHGSFKHWVKDPTSTRNAVKDEPREPDYFEVSEEALKEVVTLING